MWITYSSISRVVLLITVADSPIDCLNEPKRKERRGKKKKTKPDAGQVAAKLERARF